LHTKQTEISQNQSEQTKVFKISYYIISEVLKNVIKIIEVGGTLMLDQRGWPLLDLNNSLIKDNIAALC
jgi:hypothetical protein